MMNDIEQADKDYEEHLRQAHRAAMTSLSPERRAELNRWLELNPEKRAELDRWEADQAADDDIPF